MAKKLVFPIPKDDIPAWFMTYSDVITLLMTFFILLLTFATTEPERFEKVQTSTFTSGGATGLIGPKIQGSPKDSWINRVRPPSSRIAMRGAEMPPLMNDPAKVSWGKGLLSLDNEDRKHNELTSHHFDIEFNRLFNSKGELTSQGKQVCSTLAVQLRDLPFQAALQFTNAEDRTRVVKLMMYLLKNQQTRPGQVSLGRIENENLPPGKLRFLIRHYLANPS
jgi:flagellar motor protein MotB